MINYFDWLSESPKRPTTGHPDPSTPLRTFVKAFGWECFSFVLTLGISYLVVGDISKASWLTGILFVLKVLFLFMYERMWHRIRWGKRYQ